MYVLHNIGDRRHGSNYNTAAEIQSVLDAGERVSFDGVYLNVWEHREMFRGRYPGQVKLFPMGNWVGKSNLFDVAGTDRPVEPLCDWNQLMHLVTEYRCALGWHTWSHRNLCELSDFEVLQELASPVPMRYLAYPYGDVDARVAGLAQASGYFEAWSVTQGDDSQYQRRRRYLNW